MSRKMMSFMTSPAQCILVYTPRLEILGEWIGDMCVAVALLVIVW